MESGNESRPLLFSREDIPRLQEEFLADLIAHPPASEEVLRYRFRVSSGTTGCPTPLFGVQQQSPTALIYPAQPTRAILVARLRLTALSQVLNFRLNPEPAQAVLVLDPSTIRPRFAEHAHAFDPTEMRGSPSTMIQVANWIPAEIRTQIDRVSMQGELLTATMREKICELYPRARVVQDYGLSEIGVLTKETCSYAEPGTYHPIPNVTLEINEPDERGVGEILATKTVFRGRAIVRYRTGDNGILLPTPCLCGEKVTLKVLGRRGYDFIRIGSLQVRVEELDRVMAMIPDYATEYRAEVYTVTAEGVTRAGIILTVFREGAALEKKEIDHIAQTVTKNMFVSMHSTFAQAVQKGLLLPVEIISRHEPLPRKTKDIRLVMRN